MFRRNEQKVCSVLDGTGFFEFCVLEPRTAKPKPFWVSVSSFRIPPRAFMEPFPLDGGPGKSSSPPVHAVRCVSECLEEDVTVGGCHP